MAQLTGKVAIVTGAASGIGRAAARRFAQEGAKVCAADLNLAGAEKTAKDIKAAGGEAFACQIDVSSEADNAAMVTETVNRYGGLDIAFLNAGFYGQVADIMTTSVENFDKVISINLRGAFLGIRAVANVLRNGGAVVLTASSAGLSGFLEGPSYSASKHGVVGLVKSASHAFAKKGLRINAICPGGVATGMMVPGGVPDLETPPDQFPPVPYRGQAASEHIAEVALFLAGNRSIFMNGAAIAVDGGLTSSFGIPDDSPNKPK